MAKKSSDYWKKRFEALENTNYKESMKYYEDLQKQFRMASNEIQAQISSWYARIASNNDISYSAAKKFLNKKEIKEFKWSVEEYIKYGEENAINQKWMKELENASARVHISKLEAMQLQMQQTVEKLFVEYEGGVSDFLGKTFSSGYYNTAYEIAKGTGIGVNLHALDSDAISDFISKPWALDGKNFSDRIWANKDKLVQNLHTELTQQIVRGSSPKQAIDAIARKMDVSKSQAGNLVMTESAAIASAAKKQCMKDLDVEEFEVVATLDSHTSQTCRDMDGKHFPMSEYEINKTAPPFHCRCRSCTCPYFDDEFTEGEERTAKDADGNNYTVPADMTYNEWHEKHVVNDEKYTLKETSEKNLSQDNEQYEKYKGVIGDNIPKSLEEFQNMKYTNNEQWEYTKGLYDYLSKYPTSDKRYFDINRELKEKGIKIGVALPAQKKQAFIVPDGRKEPYHIMQRMLERNITDDMVKEYMNTSKCMFVQWKGMRQAFYSKNGVSVITKNNDEWIYKTAWSKQDYDSETLQILEVIDKHVK